jgi:hypothetical protein
MKTTRPKVRMRQYTKTKSNKGCWQVRHLALTTKTIQRTPKRQMKKTQFDTDSKSIKVDNCATATISNSIDDFEGPVTKTNYRLQGIGGLVGEIMTGTVVWHIEDDEGVVHKTPEPKHLINCRCDSVGTSTNTYVRKKPIFTMSNKKRNNHFYQKNNKNKTGVAMLNIVFDGTQGIQLQLWIHHH